MTRTDLEAIVHVLRKYASAVETTLYWNMSTSEAKKEIAETERLMAVVEYEAEKLTGKQ